jgi:hypothetical protein
VRILIGYRWFPTAVGYSLERALCALGHEVIYAGLPARLRPGYDSARPVSELITELPEVPDLYLWIDPAGSYFPLGIEDSPIPTACYLIDVHLGHWRQQVARFFDLVFVAQQQYVQPFRLTSGNDQTWWLPLAAAPDVHYQQDVPRMFEVGFVGNLARAHRATSRARRLRLIAQHFKTNDFYRPHTAEELGAVYSQSKIVINTSITGDVSMRLFEGTACGALVLTDSAANGLAQLFEIGNEIVVYRDDRDMLEKIGYYLAHDEERLRIARAGQRRTLAEHTYTHRAQRIIQAAGAPTFRRAAPLRPADQKIRLKARLEVYTHLHMLDAVFDETRKAGYSRVGRAWAALPCLVRRIML